MPPRSSWKGFLKLSLVSVPVRAFTANNTEESIHLNQLHVGCHARVRYRKVCPEHGELKSDEIVSGYEYAKDQYVVIDPEELAKLRSKADHAINIAGFVPTGAVDPIYLAGKTYYLMPDGPAGGRPYALLQQGMIDAGVNAIARVVMAGKEQLVLLRPSEGMLLMSVLSYEKAVRSPEDFQGELTEERTTPEELKLTQTLIEASRLEEFDLGSFEDEYLKKLNRLIQLKVDGQEVVQAPDPEEPKILNLMDALKKSVAEAQRKMAPSVQSTAEAGPAAAPAKKARKKKTG